MKRRHLILMLGGASSGALSVGTGAFSSAQMERGVNVSVADDESALVGYRSDDRSVPEDLDDGWIDLVTVTNQFAQSVSVVGATIEEGEAYFSDKFVPGDELDPGDYATVTGKINLDSGEEVLDQGDEIDVAVTVRVEGTGVTAEVFGDTETRRFTVERTGPTEIESVIFNGARSAKVSGASGEYTIDFWFVDKDDPDLEDDIEQTRSWTASNNINSGDSEENNDVKNRRLLAIRFQETEQTFYRPDCEIEAGDVPWTVETFIEADENGNSACNWDSPDDSSSGS